MKTHCHGFRTALVGLALATIASATHTAAQGLTPDGTIQSVRRALERLPYYGVFDFIVFRVDRGTVFLGGYSFQGSLTTAAERATKRASGVDVVVNKMEVLPASPNDDRIRWETFYRIYTDDFLSRYAPGGPHEVVRELREERRFPGMQPVGIYPIHIIVRNGRTMLLGVVDTAADRQVAELRAREVSGVFEVDNGLEVASRGNQRSAK